MAKIVDDFCKVVRRCIREIDTSFKTMENTPDRGARIARATNALEISLDIFERYHAKTLTVRKKEPRKP